MPQVPRSEETKGSTRQWPATRAAASYAFPPPRPLTSELQRADFKANPGWMPASRIGGVFLLARLPEVLVLYISSSDYLSCQKWETRCSGGLPGCSGHQ